MGKYLIMFISTGCSTPEFQFSLCAFQSFALCRVNKWIALFFKSLHLLFIVYLF